MKNRYFILLICFFACFGSFRSVALADAPIEDGVYYISNATTDGYLGLRSEAHV